MNDMANDTGANLPSASYTTAPDIMNDPDYATNTRRDDKSPEDPDTCRICRSEGSIDEPLFYPCKCSGSIKFVHQNCLMEWLSHSHKKHCELCKTPFRFTKLYDAHMPKSVPLPIFVRQAAIHTWKSVLTWTRFQLVAFVWVIWLPWCMRSVWRALFWVGDGRWVDWREDVLEEAMTPKTQFPLANATADSLLTESFTTPEGLAAAIVQHFSTGISRTWSPISRFLIPGRWEPLTFRLLRKVYEFVTGSHAEITVADVSANTTAFVGSSPRSATWLSDVPILNSLTRFTTINNMIIDTLEGQIITMCIVIAFIVIFLIREWVMQQQQEIMLGPEANQALVLPGLRRVQPQAPAAVLGINGIDGNVVDEERRLYPDVDDAIGTDHQAEPTSSPDSTYILDSNSADGTYIEDSNRESMLPWAEGSDQSPGASDPHARGDMAAYETGVHLRRRVSSPNALEDTGNAPSILGTSGSDAHTDFSATEAETILGTERGDDSHTSDASSRDVVRQSLTPVFISTDNNVSRSLVEKITDFMWGDLPEARNEQPAAVDDEEVVVDPVNEAPFVPNNRGQRLLAAHHEQPVGIQDPEVVAAAARAGVDANGADVAEEIEDLEGIMELIGMQGPIMGLIQNGMFCALLVSLTIAVALCTPYMFGKAFLVVLDSPLHILKQTLRMISLVADIVVDGAIFISMCLFYWVDLCFSMMCSPVISLVPMLERITSNKVLAEHSQGYARRALDRLLTILAENSEQFATIFDIPKTSIIAHEALFDLRRKALAFLANSCGVFMKTAGAVSNNMSYPDQWRTSFSGMSIRTRQIGLALLGPVSKLPHALQGSSLRVNLANHPRTTPFDYSLTSWNAKDRATAIFCGYLCFALLGVCYLRIAAAIRGKNKKGRVESGLADVLYQAGGVMKVVLIISIEMIIFPLFCGILLDIALLPLFESATMTSRFEFLLDSPYTSLFLHWFVGTCYMFHFALFVSMCRKIMRKGVLYFIRNPDDPTFHPIRDVLERSISSQLWKISISALVYGSLILLCLGGVVWGTSAVTSGIFPIRWSSNELVVEFPVDLIFYNFLMPLAIKSVKPSVGLTTIFGWWFRKSAHWLRLSHFLFDEQRREEQGRHVNRTWIDWLRRNKIDAISSSEHDEQRDSSEVPSLNSGFVSDGKFVHAPANDQVRVAKGEPTFIEVDENDAPVDSSDRMLRAHQGRDDEDFTRVYIPPSFSIRIGIFIASIWFFAAGAGVVAAIGPLLLGRTIFAVVMPRHMQMNDIYAFSTGVYICTCVIYAALNYRRFIAFADVRLRPHTTTLSSLATKTWHSLTYGLGLFYFYTAFGLVLPALVALLLQCYFVIPLHTFFFSEELALARHSAFSPSPASLSLPATMSSANTTSIAGNNNQTLLYSSSDALDASRPVVYFVQDWTLGMLYLKVAARLILWTAPSRPATALLAVIRDGYMKPNIWLATRGFIIPAMILMSTLLAVPLGLGWIVKSTIFVSVPSELVYRFSFPAILGIAGLVVLGWGLTKAFVRWRRRVRDEVYLIGERLHNYGESRTRRKQKRLNGTDTKGKGIAVDVPPAAPSASTRRRRHQGDRSARVESDDRTSAEVPPSTAQHPPLPRYPFRVPRVAPEPAKQADANRDWWDSAGDTDPEQQEIHHEEGEMRRRRALGIESTHDEDGHEAGVGPSGL